jgi:hypothetical protein
MANAHVDRLAIKPIARRDVQGKGLFHPATHDDPSIYAVMMRLGFHIYESRQHESKLTGR